MSHSYLNSEVNLLLDITRINNKHLTPTCVDSNNSVIIVPGRQNQLLSNVLKFHMFSCSYSWWNTCFPGTYVFHYCKNLKLFFNQLLLGECIEGIVASSSYSSNITVLKNCVMCSNLSQYFRFNSAQEKGPCYAKFSLAYNIDEFITGFM